MALNDIAKNERCNRAWWKESSIYQIYPASFKDSNGDGIGDIPGIISELDYIQLLGVDIIWLCPVYKSPQVDMGYDISDYRDIHEQYGTVADIEALTKELHRRGMKLAMDLVVNHTSDQHEWFQNSRKSINNEYRDWYIWKKPRIDDKGQRHPPNNWISYFGGSAWEFDSTTDEYYLHLFAKEQPDLNWEHTPVRQAVHDIVRFWLERGVDGFRMDVINFISKDTRFSDAPVTIPGSEWQNGSIYYAPGPRLHEYLHDLGKILLEYNAFSVGEMPEIKDCDEIIKAVGFDRHELNMIFHFEMVDIDHGPGGKYTPKSWPLAELKTMINKWQTFMYENNGWNALFLENHDQPRSVSRFASDKPEDRALSAKMLATFIGFQSGTVFVYQGQELGMANVPKNWQIKDYRDIELLNHWKEQSQLHSDETEFLKVIQEQYRLKSRDNARTPMQWNSSTNAGFTSGEPWIHVHDDYQLWNAFSQINDQSSVYNYWRKVLSLRKSFMDVFVYGSFQLISQDDKDCFAYLRSYGTQNVLVVMNFHSQEVIWKIPKELDAFEIGNVLLSSYSAEHIPRGDGSLTLRPLEAFVYLLNSPETRNTATYN
ncbi:MAG: hypothetical protein M1834_003584 [Cirrosporium novae-zelandiae]|nr:MAG: hypothetical protein M1834_003584 [Cirrosporium novae-zelandiae]